MNAQTKANDNLSEYFNDLWCYGLRNRKDLTDEQEMKLKGLIIKADMPFFKDVLADTIPNEKLINYMADVMIAKDEKRPRFEMALVNFWDEIMSQVHYCGFEERIDAMFDKREGEMIHYWPEYDVDPMQDVRIGL